MINYLIKHKKLTMIFLSFALVFTMFTSSIEQAKANTMLAVGGTIVVAGILTAMGYSYLTTGDVQAVYDKLPSNIKTMVDNKYAEITGSKLAVGTIVIGGTVIDYFKSTFGDGNLKTYTMLTGYDRSTTVSDLHLLGVPTATAKAVDYGYACYIGAMYGTTDTYVFCSNQPLQLKYMADSSSLQLSSPNSTNMYYYKVYRGWNASTSKWESYVGTATAWSQTFNMAQIGSSTSTATQKLVYSSTPIRVLDKSNVLVGFVGAEPNPAYDYVDYNSMVADEDGNYTVAVPYTGQPTTNYDAPDVLTLDTVLNGIDNLDDFFAGGGSITLSDGTIIDGSSGTNSISNSDVQAIQDALINSETTITDRILAGIKSIGSTLLGGISGVLAKIWEILVSMKDAIITFFTNIWAWCGEFFTSLGISIVDSLVHFFGMPEGFFIDFFMDLQTKFGPNFDTFLDKLRVTFSSAGTLPDYSATVTVGGVHATGKVVDFSGLRDYLPTVRSWFAGLIYFLLAWYNIKQLQNLLYSTGSLGGVGFTISNNAPSNTTDLANYNGIGGKKK